MPYQEHIAVNFLTRKANYWTATPKSMLDWINSCIKISGIRFRTQFKFNNFYYRCSKSKIQKEQVQETALKANGYGNDNNRVLMALIILFAF